jgi:hypothetical protein
VLNQKALLHYSPSESTEDLAALQEAEEVRPSKTTNAQKDPKDFLVSPSALIDINQYRPEVDHDGTWWVSEIDCEFLATGCSVLACGGGGPGYMCYMAARTAIKAGARMPVVDIETLDDDVYILGSISYGYRSIALCETARADKDQCPNRHLGAHCERYGIKRRHRRLAKLFSGYQDGCPNRGLISFGRACNSATDPTRSSKLEA